MTDTKELRRLAQAATPGPWINHGRQPNVAGLPHSAVAAKTLLARVYSEAYGDVEQETANASFIAAANPAAISELLDRLEAAESECLEQARLNGMGAEREAALLAKLEAAEKDIAIKEEVIDSLATVTKRLDAQRDDAEKERDALRAKIARMEKQAPVAWQTRTRPAWNDGTWGPWRKCSKEYAEDIKKTPSLHDWLYEARALYALQGAKGEEK